MEPDEEHDWGRRAAEIILADLQPSLIRSVPAVIIGPEGELRRAWVNHSPHPYAAGADVLGWVIGSDGSAAGLPHIWTEDWDEWLVQLADHIQEATIEDPLHWGAACPPCPSHPEHPLQPRLVDGRASWCCPRGGHCAPIGSPSST